MSSGTTAAGAGGSATGGSTSGHGAGPSAALVVRDAWIRRIERLLARAPRVILGLAGPPGAGKSTLAEALRARLGPIAQVVPMDGWHLAQAELQRLGRAERKGAPDTFDSAGFVALLQRLRRQGAGEVVWAPEFRREIEEPVAGAIAIEPQHRLLIAEGNYLLLHDGPWAGVAGLLDEAWHVDVPDALRLQRLQARHVRHGRSPAQALQWVAQTDEPNARLVEACRHRADCLFRWDGDPATPAAGGARPAG